MLATITGSSYPNESAQCIWILNVVPSLCPPNTMKAGLPVFPLGVWVHNLKADRRCRKNAVMYYVCCFPYCAPSIANSRALAIDQESIITLMRLFGRPGRMHLLLCCAFIILIDRRLQSSFTKNASCRRKSEGLVSRFLRASRLQIRPSLYRNP